MKEQARMKVRPALTLTLSQREREQHFCSYQEREPQLILQREREQHFCSHKESEPRLISQSDEEQCFVCLRLVLLPLPLGEGRGEGQPA